MLIFFLFISETDHESQLYQLQSLIEQLPVVNKDTLKRIVGHLKKLVTFSTVVFCIID